MVAGPFKHADFFMSQLIGYLVSSYNSKSCGPHISSQNWISKARLEMDSYFYHLKNVIGVK